MLYIKNKVSTASKRILTIFFLNLIFLNLQSVLGSIQSEILLETIDRFSYPVLRYFKKFFATIYFIFIFFKYFIPNFLVKPKDEI